MPDALERLVPVAAAGQPAAAPSGGAPISLATAAELLRGLDSPQQRAVTHTQGPLLVVAGPGTGKTTVVTRRIAWLVATRRARPAEILALTFTDRAADEMQARVDRLLPYGYADAAIHTFHAFGDRLVREHAFRLGLPGEPRVLGRAEAVLLLRAHLFELPLARFRPLGDPSRFLAALVSLFHRAKDENVGPREYAAHAAALAERAGAAEAAAAGEPAREAAAALREEAERETELAAVYERYQALLAGAGAIDFGDQVALAVRLLRDHADVRREVQARYRFLLVDEFQDTNPAQLELVRLLAGGRGNVTAVGDDDQSIYTFRGAAVDNLLGYGALVGRPRIVVLRRNHRSRAPILAAARRLIGHNDPGRLETRAGLDKRLTAARRSRRPAPVEACAFETTAQEADWVAGRVAAFLASGRRPGDVAILVRANADADPFLRSLNVAGIPWRFSGAAGLYARPEVRELLAFLRALADLERSVDLYAVATGEPYRLGGTDLTAVLELARHHHRSLWSVLCELDEQPGLLRLGAATRAALRRLVADLRASSELAHRRPAGEVLYDHLKRSGRLAQLAAGGPASEAALQNVARFFGLIRDRAALLPEDRVAFLAEHLRALAEAGDDPATAELDEAADAVAVLTVHKAKGLEFSLVFVVGLAEGRFPSRGRREPIALPAALCHAPLAGAAPVAEAPFAEERRLAYVALTRARDELVLTCALRGPGGRARRPSPFIAEALDRPFSGAAQAGPENGPLADLERSAAEPGPVVGARTAPRRLEVSYSQLDTYRTCPRQYQLRYELGVPAPPHHALTYGSALHQAVAAFHASEARGEPLDDGALLEVFRAAWSGEGFLSADHEAARFAAGEAALRRFRAARLADGLAAPAAVERPFSFVVDGDRLRGRIDRVDETAEGCVITDYKSSDVRDPARARQRARNSLQLAIYALAHEAETGRRPAAVQLHFLESGVVGRAVLDDRRLARALGEVRAAAEGIRQGAFAARPDVIVCGGCPFRDICASSLA